MLVPVSVSVPPPSVSAVAFVPPSWTFPAYVVVPPLTVNVEFVAAELFVTVVLVALASEPICVSNPFRSSVEVPFNVNALVPDSAFATPTCNTLVPLTVVVPPYVFAPPSVIVPPPLTVTAPVLLITPL